MRALVVLLASLCAASAQDIPKPLFYLPLDGSTSAAIAGGSPRPQFGSQPDSILTLVELQRERFSPVDVRRPVSAPRASPAEGGRQAGGRGASGALWLP